MILLAESLFDSKELTSLQVMGSKRLHNRSWLFVCPEQLDLCWQQHLFYWASSVATDDIIA